MNRSLVKTAIQNCQWDLLDKLLELDPRPVHDKRMFTDTWGEWWPPLFECTIKDQMIGVRILLKHGANPKLKSWGDCLPMSSLQMAMEQKNDSLVALLNGSQEAHYERQSEPEIPELSERDELMHRQAAIAQESGLTFQTEAFDSNMEARAQEE